MKYSESQERIIKRAHAALGIMVLFTFLIGLFWLTGKFLARTASATVPVVMGLFLAMIFRPCVNILETLLKKVVSFKAGVRLLAVTVFGLLLLSSFVAIVYLFGRYVVDQASEFSSVLHHCVDVVANWLGNEDSRTRHFLVSIGCADIVQQFTSDRWDFISAKALQFAGSRGGMAHDIGVGFLRYLSNVGSWFMTLVFAAVFLVANIDVDAFLEKFMQIPSPVLSTETKRFVCDLLKRFSVVMVRYFSRQMLVCIAEGLYFGVMFSVVGLPHGFIIGFIQGLLNFIPFVGTVACLPIIVITAYSGGGVSCLVATGLVWVVGQMLDGFVLPALVHGKDNKLEPWLVLFSFMFWGALFNSVLGMVLAIPMTAFAKSALVVVCRRMEPDGYPK